ncbi:sialic acid-binding Ig-like lectin 13 isoform X1 [Ambystoma mexicanum]|uniref:sialic acid-binding Ig-like lectin 13 isoform X1 n=1 Tax=Ambystoma mexicanum TaxID=8296 RepID=UPI0037E96EA1
MEPPGNHQKKLFLQFLSLAFFPSMYGNWTVTVPTNITTWKHSCLVIPCSFNFPGDAKEKVMKAIWYRFNTSLFLSGHFPNTAHEIENNRASLVGLLIDKHCSLLIKNVTEEDTEATYNFIFRIEIEKLDNYTFMNNPVKITLKASSPQDLQLVGYQDEIRKGEKVILQCNTTHSCIVEPPTISWTPKFGIVTVEDKDLGDGRWEVISKLTFIASQTHDTRSMTCMIQYGKTGESQNKTTAVFSVLYAPEISPDSECRLAFFKFKCVCAVLSNPPPLITWHLPDRNVSSTENEINYKSFSGGRVTKTYLRETASLGFSTTCSASNTEGTAVLRLPNRIDVTSFLVMAAAVLGSLLVLAVILPLVVWRYRRRRSCQHTGSTKDTITGPMKSGVEMTDDEFNLASDNDYENVSIKEETTSGVEMAEFDLDSESDDVYENPAIGEEPKEPVKSAEEMASTEPESASEDYENMGIAEEPTYGVEMASTEPESASEDYENMGIAEEPTVGIPLPYHMVLEMDQQRQQQCLNIPSSNEARQPAVPFFLEYNSCDEENIYLNC